MRKPWMEEEQAGETLAKLPIYKQKNKRDCLTRTDFIMQTASAEL